MHSGFIALRGELPQNIRARRSARPLSPTCLTQVARVAQVWEECRATYGEQGNWLFGEFSIADVFFAPVALRFATYGISLSGAVQHYVETVQKLESVQEWCELAREETEAISFIDELVPADEAPLIIG
jgi:glutathione S-transferase